MKLTLITKAGNSLIVKIIMDIAVAVHWLTDTTLECLLFSSINAIYHEFDLQTQKSVFEIFL